MLHGYRSYIISIQINERTFPSNGATQLNQRAQARLERALPFDRTVEPNGGKVEPGRPTGIGKPKTATDEVPFLMRHFVCVCW